MGAVALNLLRETRRQRLALPFLIAVVLVAVLLPRSLPGDETLRGRLQLAVVYGLGVPLFLIAAATVVMAAGAVSRELQSGTIQLLAARPLARWRIVLGKLLGVLLLDLILLVALFLGFAASVLLTLHGMEWPTLEREIAAGRFLSPRRGVLAEAEVDQEAVRRLVARALAEPVEGHRARSPAQVEAAVRWRLRTRMAAPGESVQLLFRGLEPPAAGRDAGDLYLRYELQASSPGPLPEVDLAVRWEVRPPGASPEAGAARAPFIVREEKKWGVVHEFAIPAGHVSPEGELRIEAWNEEPGASGVKLFLDPERAEVLAICGRFWPNVCRSFGLLLAQLGLVASVAAAAGALFSFPTANLVGFFVYGSGLAAGFLRETLAPAARGEAGASLAVRLEEAVRALGRAALEVLPDFAAHDPLDRLAAGRAVGVADLAAGAGWMLCVQGGILFLLAIWSLSRRELARAEEG